VVFGTSTCSAAPRKCRCEYTALAAAGLKGPVAQTGPCAGRQRLRCGSTAAMPGVCQMPVALDHQGLHARALLQQRGAAALPITIRAVPRPFTLAASRCRSRRGGPAGTPGGRVQDVVLALALGHEEALVVARRRHDGLGPPARARPAGARAHAGRAGPTRQGRPCRRPATSTSPPPLSMACSTPWRAACACCFEGELGDAAQVQCHPALLQEGGAGLASITKPR
jgi:hypothetical protein